MTDETLGLLLCLPLFRLNPLLVRSLAGDGGVVLVEEAMSVKRFGQVPNDDGPLEVLLFSGRPPFTLWDQLPLCLILPFLINKTKAK